MPDQLLIIDQSTDDVARQRVLQVVAECASAMDVDYVLDPQIAGLVAAKQDAVSRARGDVICFLEDDIVLEPDYLAEIERGFAEKPEMVGCCGVVTNLPPLAPFYFQLFHLFHRGIFFDARVGVHGKVDEIPSALIVSNYISGGASAYRRQVFDAVPLDLENGFFALEDIDFSTRVAARFGPHLYINPRARLQHLVSPVNRAVLGARHERKVREFLVFYKKQHTDARVADLAFLVAGLFLEAAFQAAQQRTLSPMAGYFRGLWQGARWKIVTA